MKNKKAFEFSFAWLFAILVGAMIIFLAIYAAVRLSNTLRAGGETIEAESFGIILTPIETNLEGSKVLPIKVKEPTRIYNNPCRKAGVFGSQDIQFSVKSNIGEAWSTELSPAVSFHNKYLFSESPLEAKSTFFVLSKPFYFPYKVADLTMIWSDNVSYCFVSAPVAVQTELTELGAKRINFTSSISDCPVGSLTVCIRDTSCDISIDENTGGVTKESTTVYYAESLFSPNDKYALLYAAVFSSPQIYECQVKRLMARASELATLYLGKSNFLSTQRGCTSTNMQSPLASFQTATLSIAQDPSKNSHDLIPLATDPNSPANTLYSNNANNRFCPLF
jgi:hypothetical protein